MRAPPRISSFNTTAAARPVPAVQAVHPSPPAPTTPQPTSLFPGEDFTVDSRFKRPRKTEPADKDSITIHLDPYMVLHIYKDGTGGAEAPRAIARMDTCESSARRRKQELQKHIDFIDRWLALPKREKVELYA